MFWIVTNGKYQIVGKNVHNIFKDIVLTSSTTTSVANIVAKGILKEKPTVVSNNLKFFIPAAESSFINLCDSPNEDGPSFVNVVVPVFMNS